MISNMYNKMSVKDRIKNQEYVAKHCKNVRKEMGEDACKKREAQARKLRGLEEKEKKAHEAKTLSPLDMEALKNYTALRPMDINNLINLLSPPPARKQQKKREPKPKQSKDVTDNMTAKEKRRNYIRDYMR